ncbi:MAG TPA: ATP-binding protein [Anaerolineae bacterium]|nr:ATP-binding protein [Anaerolineae bacterium]
MKCRSCGGPAAVNMRQHRLGLCPDHFMEWFVLHTERVIEEYRMFAPGDRVLLAVSGGKDSLALWDVLLRLGHDVEGLHIDLGIQEHDYSEQSREMVERFAAEKGAVPFRVFDVEATYGRSVPDIALERRGRKVCSLCGLMKRHIMNRVAYEGGFAAVATGHNLDDEAAVLFQNTLHWQTGYLARQAPVLPSNHPHLARKVKPFFRFYERDTAAYAVLREIPYIYDECPYSQGATTIFYKELLNQLEARSRGAKQQFYLSFLQAREQEGLFRADKEESELGECERCGQPTSAPGLCAFCRLWKAE